MSGKATGKKRNRAAQGKPHGFQESPGDAAAGNRQREPVPPPELDKPRRGAGSNRRHRGRGAN